VSDHHDPFFPALHRNGPGLTSVVGERSLENCVIPVRAIEEHEENSDTSARVLKKDRISGRILKAGRMFVLVFPLVPPAGFRARARVADWCSWSAYAYQLASRSPSM
jgi:hypothetical protein